MTAAFDFQFVIRPLPALASLASSHAWFAVPMTCSFSAVTRSLAPLDEAELKLRFLARIHEDTVEPPRSEWEALRRDDARALLDVVPLDLATFDRLWTLELVGLPIELSVRHLSSESLRAVLPRDDVRVEGPTAMQSLRKHWAHHLVVRPTEEACALAALRHAVARLFAALPDELKPPQVSAHGLAGVPPRAQLDAALAEDGWVQAPDATLWIALSEIHHPTADEQAARVRCRFRALALHPRRRTLIEGAVACELRHSDGRWSVVETTMESTAKRVI